MNNLKIIKMKSIFVREVSQRLMELLHDHGYKPSEAISLCKLYNENYGIATSYVTKTYTIIPFSLFDSKNPHRTWNTENRVEVTYDDLVRYFSGIKFKSEVEKVLPILDEFIFSRSNQDKVKSFKSSFELQDWKQAYNTLNDIYWDLPDSYNIMNRPDGFMEILSIVDDDNFKSGKFN